MKTRAGKIPQWFLRLFSCPFSGRGESAAVCGPWDIQPTSLSSSHPSSSFWEPPRCLAPRDCASRPLSGVSNTRVLPGGCTNQRSAALGVLAAFLGRLHPTRSHIRVDYTLFLLPVLADSRPLLLRLLVREVCLGDLVSPVP